MHRPLTRREVVIIFGFWTFLAVLSSANWLIGPRGSGFRPIDPTGPILLAFVESWTWAALTPLIFRLATRFSPARIPLLIVVGIALSIAVFIFLDLARDVLLSSMQRRPFRAASELTRGRFVPQLLFYFAILAAGFAREYFL